MNNSLRPILRPTTYAKKKIIKNSQAVSEELGYIHCDTKILYFILKVYDLLK